MSSLQTIRSLSLAALALVLGGMACGESTSDSTGGGGAAGATGGTSGSSNSGGASGSAGAGGSAGTAGSNCPGLGCDPNCGDAGVVIDENGCPTCTCNTPCTCPDWSNKSAMPQGACNCANFSCNHLYCPEGERYTVGCMAGQWSTMVQFDTFCGDAG